jgi:potassium efflux system protein
MSITVVSFIEFLFLTAFFFWLVKWTYEFCYRYLFRNIRDHGIRNSLSTFTQYAVLTLGVVFTLRVLGIDLTGMSYVLGGLAVGMGFGLRDFASNIVGGIILLIERPLKEGDVVAFDTFEGRVEHIGIRSIRMRSWDNMQVLVPNSETFNRPFTNWTHQDSIVRTVVPIKIHRSDSPVQIQNLIMEVLEIIPEVLKTPEPQVLLKNIDEVLYEFELRYYINIDNSQRMTVRSQVLFALSSQFKAAGIKEPVPSLQIEQLNKSE